MMTVCEKSSSIIFIFMTEFSGHLKVYDTFFVIGILVGDKHRVVIADIVNVNELPITQSPDSYEVHTSRLVLEYIFCVIVMSLDNCLEEVILLALCKLI